MRGVQGDMLYISCEGTVHRLGKEVTDYNKRSTLPELIDTRSLLSRVYP